MKNFFIVAAIVVVSLTTKVHAEELLLTKISIFEAEAQQKLETMVINHSVNVGEINKQINIFSSQLSSLPTDESFIALNILGEVAQAVALVEARA